MSPATSCSMAILQDLSTTKTVVDKYCRNPVEQMLCNFRHITLRCQQ